MVPYFQYDWNTQNISLPNADWALVAQKINKGWFQLTGQLLCWRCDVNWSDPTQVIEAFRNMYERLYVFWRSTYRSPPSIKEEGEAAIAKLGTIVDDNTWEWIKACWHGRVMTQFTRDSLPVSLLP